MGDPVEASKIVDLAEPIERPAATKASGRSLAVFSGGRVTRDYDLISSDGSVAFLWAVNIVNGECIGNGGGLPGLSVYVKDGYNQILNVLTNPKGDVFDAIDALIKSWGLTP